MQCVNKSRNKNIFEYEFELYVSQFSLCVSSNLLYERTPVNKLRKMTEDDTCCTPCAHSSSDLAPSNYGLFSKLKVQYFSSDAEVEVVMPQWIENKSETFFMGKK